jgi:hypothetical protein
MGRAAGINPIFGNQLMMQNITHCRIRIYLFCFVSLALAIAPAAALAQSGSAGGIIGDDQKSLSGSRSEPPPDREAPTPPGGKPEELRQSPPGSGSGIERNFDGTWVYTGIGTNCPGSGSGTLVISGGLVSSKNGHGIGRVSPDGSYRAATVGADGVPLTATGRMSANTGSGSYRRADGCAGRWTARRM